jgi:catechol 2,3-dioxygenase-like lactoylglutathione lyase family enzyme
MISLELGLVTDDADRLLAFYTDGFGFELERSLTFPQGVVHRLRRDAACLKLFQPAEGAEARPPSEPWHRFGGITYGALHVDDAEATVAGAVAAGAGVLMALTSHRPGAKAALVTDPDGNVWEVLEES